MGEVAVKCGKLKIVGCQHDNDHQNTCERFIEEFQQDFPGKPEPCPGDEKRSDSPCILIWK